MRTRGSCFHQVEPTPHDYLLDEHALVLELRRAGYLTSDDITSGLRVINVSQRHRNWLVRTGNAGSFLVKQATGPDEQRTLNHEATIYRRLSTSTDAIAGALPRVIGHDPVQHLLLVNFVMGQSLAEMLDARESSSTAPATALGMTLACLHATGLDLFSPDELVSTPPWVLDVCRPAHGWFTTSSEAGLRLRALIQHRPTMVAGLDLLRHAWGPRALIHGDLKLQHVIFPESSAGVQEIAIVDWEMAQAGDPAWDTGAVIAGLLGAWLRSIPLVDSQPLATLADRARVPLDRMQQTTRAFWRGYVADATNSGERREMLVMAGRFAAAWLVKDLVERLQETRMSQPRINLVLDCSEQLLRNPVATLGALAAIDRDLAAA